MVLKIQISRNTADVLQLQKNFLLTCKFHCSKMWFFKIHILVLWCGITSIGVFIYCFIWKTQRWYWSTFWTHFCRCENLNSTLFCAYYCSITVNICKKIGHRQTLDLRDLSVLSTSFTSQILLKLSIKFAGAWKVLITFSSAPEANLYLEIMASELKSYPCTCGLAISCQVVWNKQAHPYIF